MKAFVEHQIYIDTAKCPELIIKDTLIKYETKMKDLKEEVKDKKESDPNSKSDEKIRFVKNE